MGVSAKVETGEAATAEDKIHWTLVVLLGAIVVALRLGEPPAPSAAASARGAAPAIDAAREIERAELDAAIARLESWVERALAQASTPRATLLGWQALGRRAIEPELASSFAPTYAEAPFSTLSVLLEAGVGPQTELASGAEVAPLGTWATELLARGARDAPARSSAGELDLSSLAVLAGEIKERERLDALARRGLQALDRRRRTLPWRPGRALDPAERAALAAAWNDAREQRARSQELELSAAVFRAVAVLGERQLLLQARRHLNTLLSRYAIERALRASSLRDSTDSAHGLAARTSAVEELGRFEQALFNAHVAFRQSESAPPPEHLGRTMRQAAFDLVRTLDGVTALSTPSSAREPADLDLLAAAVHALRGLRTARAAT